MSEKTESLLSELLGASIPELRSRLEKDLPGGFARWAEALRNEAGRYYHTDASRARGIAERALLIAEHSGDPLTLGWGHRALAEAFLFSGRMRDAEVEYGKAAAAWRRARDPRLLGQVLVGRAPVLSLLGKHREAEAAVVEARRNLIRAKDHAYLAKLAMNMGNIHFQRDDYPRALAEYQEAARSFAKLGVRDEAVLGLEVNRAVVLTQMDRVEEALRLFGRLEAECEGKGYDLLLAQIRMNAAYVHSLRADYRLALSGLVKATNYFKETDHPAFLASCYLNRAEIYQQLNLHRDALDLASSAAPLFVNAGLRYDEGLTRFQAALSLLALEDWDGARSAIERGLRLFRKEKNASRVALMELLHAHEQLGRGRRGIARRRLESLIARFGDLGLIRWRAAAAVLLARSRSRGRDLDETARALRDLLVRVPGKVYPLQSYQILSTLGELEEERGRFREAGRYYRLAVSRVEDVRVRIPTEDSKINFLRGKTYIFDRLISLELDKGRPSTERLFSWMERARSQSLLDRMRDPGAYMGSGDLGESMESDRIGALRRQIAWLHARLSRCEIGSATEREMVPALRKRLSEMEASWARSLRERAESLSGRRGALDHRYSDAEDLSDHLPEDCAFLSYHLGQDFALAVVVTRSGAVHQRLDSSLGARVQSLADRLDFQWGAAALHAVRSRNASGQASSHSAFQILRNTAESILRELHEALWKPIESIGVDATRWMISPHGPIHRIPLHALLGDRGFLAEELSFSIQPSARVWRETGARRAGARSTEAHAPRRSRPRRAWIAGVASEELPGVRREVELVAGRLQGWDTKTDLAPGRRSFLEEASRSDLLHVAAHGSLRRENPAFSSLQLIDGPLFVHDLSGLRMPGSTVVLTACSSGRGEAPAGDEWIGLARGFLRAGATAIVASLWPIQDQPTVDLIDAFYASYASGIPPAEALTTAMRATLPRYPHPWEWGSFSVLGGI